MEYGKRDLWGKREMQSGGESVREMKVLHLFYGSCRAYSWLGYGTDGERNGESGIKLIQIWSSFSFLIF